MNVVARGKSNPSRRRRRVLRRNGPRQGEFQTMRCQDWLDVVSVSEVEDRWRCDDWYAGGETRDDTGKLRCETRALGENVHTVHMYVGNQVLSEESLLIEVMAF